MKTMKTNRLICGAVVWDVCCVFYTKNLFVDPWSFGSFKEVQVIWVV